MSDRDTTIQALKDAVEAFQKQRDWRQYHSPKNLAMGIAIEAGELMEHFQWLSQQEAEDVVDDAETIQAIREELSDVLCYVINMAVVLNVDISDAFYAKMEKNAQKYPAEQYRGKYKL